MIFPWRSWRGFVVDDDEDVVGLRKRVKDIMYSKVGEDGKY